MKPPESLDLRLTVMMKCTGVASTHRYKVKKPQATAAARQPRAAGITAPTTRERAYGAVASGAAHRYEPNFSEFSSSGGPYPEQVEVVWDSSIMPITKGKMPQREQVIARYRYTPGCLSRLRPGNVRFCLMRQSRVDMSRRGIHARFLHPSLTVNGGALAKRRAVRGSYCLQNQLKWFSCGAMTLHGCETPLQATQVHDGDRKSVV